MGAIEKQREEKTERQWRKGGREGEEEGEKKGGSERGRGWKTEREGNPRIKCVCVCVCVGFQLRETFTVSPSSSLLS